MKLERMNDQQIRCTLTSEDLAIRKIKLSELAYGTDKARSLFREMMNKAADELDFEAEDMPLMIEAVPMNSECIVLTVTKVEDPEELDTRFAQFAPSLINDDDDSLFDEASQELDIDTDEELTNLFRQINAASSSGVPKEDIPIPETMHLVRLFSFASIGDLIKLSTIIADDCHCESSVFKDNRTGKYLLFIEQGEVDLLSFNRICNIISEYGNSEKNLLATQAYLEEHCECIVPQGAISRLAQI